MSWRLTTAPIRTQVLLLSLGPILILAISTTLTKPLIPDGREEAAYAAALAGRVSGLVDLARRAGGPAELDIVMRLSAETGLTLESLTPIEMRAVRGIASTPGRAGRLVAADLAARGAPIEVVRLAAPAGEREVALAPLDAQRMLAVTLPEPPDFPLVPDLVLNVAVKLALLVLPALLLAAYAGRVIAAPLMRFARAAGEMGPEIDDGRRFEAEGCREVRTLAVALNAMKSRVADVLKDRRSVMRAVSHDLRTPLTRLRLRAERCEQPALREALLSDVTHLQAMVENCLLYITNPQEAEGPEKTDLASLMQTIANDFCDVGVDVAYRGPQRFSHLCKPQALARAVTNLVANAARFATRIELRLQPGAKGGVSISVLDDGPGIPALLRERMVQPFAKGDAARASAPGGGFGLGLAITQEIARSHGGTLVLADNVPSGLHAELRLPPGQAGEAPA